MLSISTQNYSYLNNNVKSMQYGWKSYKGKLCNKVTWPDPVQDFIHWSQSLWYGICRSRGKTKLCIYRTQIFTDYKIIIYWVNFSVWEKICFIEWYAIWSIWLKYRSVQKCKVQKYLKMTYRVFLISEWTLIEPIRWLVMLFCKGYFDNILKQLHNNYCD